MLKLSYFPGQKVPLDLLCGQSALPASLLEHRWTVAAMCSGQAGPGSSFDTPNPADLHPASSLVRLHRHLGSADKQATGWAYCVGAAGRNLVFQDLSAGCCKALPTSLSNQIPSQVLQISLKTSWGKTRAGNPNK